MLWTVLVILMALWALGVVASIAGGVIHILLVLAAVILVAQLLKGRRSTS